MDESILYCAVYRKGIRPTGETTSFLSLAEKSVFSSLTSKRRLRCWLASRIAAKHAISYSLLRHAGIKIHPQAVEIYSGLRGEPCWRVVDQTKTNSLPLVDISLAHTYKESIAVGSLYPIGIDIESLRRLKKNIMSYFLCESEIKIIQDNFPSLSQGGVIFWTLKEAAVKCLGTGFIMAPKNIKINHFSTKQALIEVKLPMGSTVRLFGRYECRGRLIISIVSSVKEVVAGPLSIMKT